MSTVAITAPDDKKRISTPGIKPKNRARTAGLRRTAVGLAVFAAFLLMWWGVTAAGLIKPLFLPSPGAVWDAAVQANSCRPVAAGAERLVCGEQNYFMWEHLIASLQRIGAGVGMAIVFGVVLGFIMGTIKPINTVIEPYLNFLRSLPPLGYIGLLIVWFGIGDVSKIWLLFLAAFPPVAMATISGVSGIRQDRIHAAQSLGASRWQVLTNVILPSSLSEIFSGIRIAVGFAWTTVVAAELNNGIPGIGGLAYISGTQLQTPLTIACIIVIGIAAIALDVLIKNLGRLLVPWHGKA
ncbi:ABC transporter permease subunit [Pseudarthrobacter sp. AL07]|uniref:ABC transporter permease n=1 Tax=unclassified Pseudarthrobacter TaxID=2647000 RepID=UPI00249C019D|nr:MULTISPECIES: ABC transporter permease subunit [unclassified Pseudarthrobacter]MDI3196263.1 ABC transporter permease subunit [Pseudarthrobacter sp. AL20]MDI3210322.1 ABC transporter permease subunit [Pseudarthrobacter sp. AL07]